MFLISLQQVGVLLTFIFIGYILRRKNIITNSGKKVLATLLVNIFAPAYSIVSLSTQLSLENIDKYLIYILIGAVVTMVLVFIAIPVSKLFSKDKFERNMFNYAIAFGNIGYFGYPVIGSIFGAEARAMMIIFCLPMSIAIYTYGYSILTDKSADETICHRKSFYKKLSFIKSPPFLGALIGITIGLLPFELPVFFNDILTIAANCQSAPAMILTGVSLASVPFSQLFTSWRPYVVGLMRLLIIPFVFGGIIYLCGIKDMLFMLIVVSVAMPVGMNVVVYPESVGKDGTEGAKLCFISYILALLTIPLIFTLIGQLIIV